MLLIRNKDMKLAASLAAFALIASPALAQETVHTTVHTTTRHIHATNVPVRRHVVHHPVRHRVVHCTRVTRHGRTYCAKPHRVIVKTVTTSTHR
jgi:hypothetical protein